MRVSLQPRYITHYRSSIGLISTPYGKLMDQPPPNIPIASLRSAVRRCNRMHYRVQCPYPMEIVPLYGRAVEGLAAAGTGRWGTMHSLIFFIETILRPSFPANSEYRCDDRCLRTVTAVVRIRASFTTARDTDEWFIEEHRVRGTTIVSQSHFEILEKSEKFNMNLFHGKSIFHKKGSILYVYIYIWMYSQLFVNSYVYL